MDIRELMIGFIYRVVAAPFRMLPLRRGLIVFESYYGKGFEDSPSIIAQELYSRNISDLQMIWLVRNSDEARSLPEYVKPVKRFTLKELYYLSKASIWIDNCRKTKGIIKRKNQYYIQTWHSGISGKKVERDAIDSLSPGYVENAKHDSQIADVFLSGSRWSSDLYRSAFWYNGEILEEGLPRNDVFFLPHQPIINKVRTFYSLESDIKIVVYAPTFRKSGNLAAYDIDYLRLLKELSLRWGGKWVLLIRMHPSAIALQNGFKYTDNILNGSIYPEMNDLIIACDLLISDYSSCLFDALLVNKRIVQYASDIQEYSIERGSYFDYDKLPFPLAENMDQLISVLKSYDYNVEIDHQNKFLSECGSVERGVAAKTIVDRIINELGV